MKIDPYHSKEKYENWLKKGGFKDLSEENSKILLEYLEDMRNGYNVTRPGPRSYIRLNNLRQRLRWISLQLKKHYNIDDMTKISKREITCFFNDLMRNGIIKNKFGKLYKSVADYANTFKAFWHWYQKRQEDLDQPVKDITIYIDMSPVSERSFVYLTIDDVKKMAMQASFYYRTLIWFLFDSGIRAPTELMNIKVENLRLIESGHYELTIREEVSKTFGRKPKLILSSEILKEYIEINNLTSEDYIFYKRPGTMTKYIRNLALKSLGNKKTRGGEEIRRISMYDFRHSSACYWLPRYKSESAYKFRFGWKENKMIHYYTKLLGMKDTIQENDIILSDVGKSKMGPQISVVNNSAEIMGSKYESEIKEMRDAMKKELVREILKELNLGSLK
ncbi:site-specific integrase [archaeon]|jgi:integrase|nr:site-specific integrase [archaeon]MBT7192658.1 site-specific integrase [archaeon]MBT7381295.1 site-specific integrase [archaeon]MBT7507762.1 site-specific integrase [archaeon]